jgi:hypothetical protein
MPFVVEFTDATLAANDRREVATVRQRFRVQSVDLTNGSVLLYFNTSSDTANPFSSVAGQDGYFWQVVRGAGTSSLISFSDGGNQLGVPGAWAPTVPVLPANATPTDFVIESDGLGNITASMTNAGTTYEFVTTTAPPRSGRFAGFFSNNGNTGTNGEWSRFDAGTVPNAPTDPVVSNWTATSAEVDVTPPATGTAATGFESRFKLASGSTWSAWTAHVPAFYVFTGLAQDIYDGETRGTNAIGAGAAVAYQFAPLNVWTGGGSGPSGAVLLTGGPFTIAEGQTVCGIVTITDFDQPSGHTTVIAGLDAALFALVAVPGQAMQRQLVFLSAPNFEMPLDVGANNVYNITITATDSLGNVSAPLAVVVTVTDVNESATTPTLSGGPFVALEGQTSCGVITIQDVDQQSGHSVVLSGVNASLFALTAVPGQPMQRQLSFIAPASYSVGGSNTYNVSVTATDSQLNVSSPLAVVVTVAKIITALALSGATTLNPNQSSVYTVVDQSNRPVETAALSWLGANGGTFSGVTNSQGQVTLTTGATVGSFSFRAQSGVIASPAFSFFIQPVVSGGAVDAIQAAENDQNPKYTEEMFPYVFDFAGILAEDEAIMSILSVTCQSSPVSYDPNSAAMLLGTPQIFGKRVVQFIDKGRPNATYIVRVNVQATRSRATSEIRLRLFSTTGRRT